MGEKTESVTNENIALIKSDRFLSPYIWKHLNSRNAIFAKYLFKHE